ncbi:MAG: 1-acyl-sn-glycerol-3-phosphate acyltransferase [Chthoniobacterales bacterium]|nr:1-acyl-sn-glycerol-3-phosphate acyltransferase [Chthoniobacterales bacterium]
MIKLRPKPDSRLRRFPREPDTLVYGVREVVALLIRGWLRSYHRLTIIGREHLPNDRGFVMVANHSSHLDTLCLLAALPLRRLHRAFPAAAADYFFQSFPRIWIAAVVMNALPFARQMRVRESLSLCSQILETPGNILIMFPEGTRSPNGETREFKSGVAALLAGRDVDVLPCYVEGAFRAWPKGIRLPRPRKVRLIVGAPRNYAARTFERSDLAAIAADLRRAVTELGDVTQASSLSGRAGFQPGVYQPAGKMPARPDGQDGRVTT